MRIVRNGYYYLIDTKNGFLRDEWGGRRIFDTRSQARNYIKMLKSLDA